MASRLSFELNPNQLAIRNILSNKNFIEIEIDAISNADPNRNSSCFTLQSMEDGIHTFTDTPILGFFNSSEDFEQHNGRVAHDRELNIDYWDNSGGEQILGFIREKDHKEIVEKNGLKWIRCTAMICTRYNFKQVKRLLKDAKKKVSVEVEVLESEWKNGIEYIYKFRLLGITILGSKGGIPIMEGIEGAHLSILDLINTEPINQQRQALAFAYAELNKEEDGKLANVNSNPEDDVTQMTNSAEPTSEPTLEGAQFAAQTTEGENKGKEGEEGKPAEGGEGHQENNAAKGDEGDNDDDASKTPKDPEDGGKTQEDFKVQCDELKMKCEEYEARCAEYEAKCNTYESRCTEYESTIQKCNEELEKYADYDSIKTACEQYQAELEALKQKDKDRVKDEQLCHLDALCKSMKLSEEDVKDVREKCCSYAFASNDEINKEVAYISWQKNFNVAAQEEQHFSVTIDPTLQTTEPENHRQGDVRARLKKNLKK